MSSCRRLVCVALWLCAGAAAGGETPADPASDAPVFAADYARYRGREIVAVRSVASYERQRRQLATRAAREPARP